MQEMKEKASILSDLPSEELTLRLSRQAAVPVARHP